MYEFTSDYFGNCEIKNELEKNAHKQAKWKILEIGSFEGSSATYFSDNLLDHPESKLTCVDPFDSGDSTTPFTKSGTDTMYQFINNISKSKNFQKITFYRLYSSEFYKNNKETFNFIYVDGSHLVEDVENDFKECLKILEPGGFIAFDDYRPLAECIDKLYEEYKEQITMVGSGYQIMFIKSSSLA